MQSRAKGALQCYAIKIPPRTPASTSGSTSTPTPTGLKSSKAGLIFLSSESARSHANNSSSVIAVQGLGAHKYYTWDKKKSSASQQEKPKPVFGSDFIQRRRRIARTPEDDDTLQSSMNAARIKNDPTVEIMWLRDLLPRSLPNARIATYSYQSDWRQDVKTNLRECGIQFLNVLYQHRVDVHDW